MTMSSVHREVPDSGPDCSFSGCRYSPQALLMVLAMIQGTSCVVAWTSYLPLTRYPCNSNSSDWTCTAAGGTHPGDP